MGNTCNLACAICGSHSSSKWGSIDKSFGIEYKPYNKWQDEDSSDEAQSEITEFENDQTTHNQESITQTTELKPIDTSKDNLENSSDEDKVQDL